MLYVNIKSMVPPKTLFWTVCIPIRIAIAVIVYASILPKLLVAIWLACIGVGFLTIYTFRLRMHAPESSTPTTWWHEYRIYHGILYVLAAVSSLFDQRLAGPFLVIDVLLGGVLSLYFRV